MTIYLDMDGVIADFFKAFAKKNNVKHWKSIKEKEKALVDLHNTDFFNNIPTFGDKTYKIVQKVRDLSWSIESDWGICSSPLRGDHNNSAYWKRHWLEKHDIMPEVENCIFTSSKHKYAVNKLTGKPNILVDDKIDNIKRWEAAGGIGILFQTDQDDVNDLFNELEKACHSYAR